MSSMGLQRKPTAHNTLCKALGDYKNESAPLVHKEFTIELGQLRRERLLLIVIRQDNTAPQKKYNGSTMHSQRRVHKRLYVKFK